MQISDSFEESDDDPFEKPEYIKHREMGKPPSRPVSSVPKENDEGFFSFASSPRPPLPQGTIGLLLGRLGLTSWGVQIHILEL